MEPVLEFRLLGGAEIDYGGNPLRLTAVKPRALLIYLALTNRRHTRDALAGLLWGDMPDGAAKANLRQALTTLRRLLPYHLVVSRNDVRLNPHASTAIDVHDFETAVRQAGDRDIELLKTAADLYRGDLLDGFLLEDVEPFVAWALPQQQRLRALALQTLHTLVGHYARCRQVRQGLDYATQLLALEPWREASHRQMMRLLAWDGQFTAALAQYKTCEHLLQEELGVDPLPETTQLYQRIRAARQSHRVVVPTAPDAFVAREELGELIGELHQPDCRLLTVVGIGGVGKTRLVQEAARQQAALYLDGVYFIELAGLAAGSQVETAVAAVLGLSLRGADSSRQLTDFLRDKEILLVLDNFEHLLHDDVAVSLLLKWLETAPDLNLLVSSRERLHLAEEWVFTLEGLSCPPPGAEVRPDDYASLRLFQQTAQRVQRHFDVARERTAVVAICHMTQGLPLGIKLAAALTPQQTAAQIAQALQANLDVLATRLRNVPDRQRSLRATFDYSWRLLTPPQQRLLAQLSLFRGSFSRAAATAVTGAGGGDLAALVDKSLLETVADGRYELHLLLRDFAAERLAPPDGFPLRQRYTRYYLRWLAGLQAALEGHEARTAVSQISADLDNVRQAWQWGTADDEQEAIAAALPTLTTFYTLASSAQEGAALVQQAVAAFAPKAQEGTADGAPQLLARLLTGHATLCWQQGMTTEAIADARRAIALLPADADRFVADALLQWGQALQMQGELETAVAKLQQARSLAAADGWLLGEAIAQERLGATFRNMGLLEQAVDAAQRGLALAQVLGNPHQESACLNVLSISLHGMGDYAQALAYGERALQMLRARGDKRGESTVLSSLSIIYIALGDLTAAQQAAERSLEINHELGDRRRTSRVLNNLGLCALHQSQLIKARHYFEQALTVDRLFSNRRHEGLVLGNLGNVALCLGDYPQAHTFYKEALAIRREINDRSGQSHVLLSLCLLHGYRERYQEALTYGREALAIITATGARSREGFAHLYLGHAYLGLEQYTAARQAYETALAIRQEVGQPHLLGVNVAGLAVVAWRQGALDEALRWVEQALAAVAAGQLRGARDSGLIAWNCYQVLRAAGDERATAVLETAVQRIQTIAEGIRNREQRHSYLHNVRTHRQLLAAWAAGVKRDTFHFLTRTPHSL